MFPDGLYERIASEGEHEHSQPDGLHIARRGSGRDAARLVRAIIANHNEQARTAHDIAANADREQLPDRVRSLLIDRRARAMHARRAAYQDWQNQTRELLAEREHWIDQHLSRSRDQGLDYGIEL